VFSAAGVRGVLLVRACLQSGLGWRVRRRVLGPRLTILREHVHVHRRFGTTAPSAFTFVVFTMMAVQSAVIEPSDWR